VLPFDLVPDFIPIAGPFDDTIFVAVAIAYVARSAGRDVCRGSVARSERGLRIVLALS
jgi:uncharacterized membrane protein YkvA (DUF1232 family)